MNEKQIEQFINDYLANLQLLKVSEETTEHIRNKLKVIRVKSKGTLLLPGEICRNMYVVAHGGFVCRYVHEKTGAAKTINFYLPDLHPVMACVDSYFTQTPTDCELKAISESVVISLPKTVVTASRKKDEYFENFHEEIISTAIMEENEVKSKLIAYSSKEKYEFIIEDMPSVIQSVPSKYIAEFCGVSAEWLSKLKKQY